MTFTQDEREIIQAAYEQSPMPEVPNELRDSLDKLVDEYSQHELTQESATVGWGRYAAMAACVCVGLTGGVLFTQQGLQQGTKHPIAIMLSTDVHEKWVQRVADYQSLYTESTIATLSPTREADAIRLLESVNTIKPTRTAIPDLSEFGYTFARAQQLGFDGTPLVQLVYTKPGSAPLAFCYMSGDTKTHREFQVATVHGLGTASWANDGQHFVLVGDEAATVMGEIHQAVENVF